MHGQAPKWLLVNSDIRKLEKVCKGKVPPKENIQDLLAMFDERCSAPNAGQANDFQGPKHCPIIPHKVLITLNLRNQNQLKKKIFCYAEQ